MKRATTVGIILTQLTYTVSARSDEHLVSPAIVEMRLAEVVKERSQDIDILEALLVSPEGAEAVAWTGGDSRRLAQELPALSDADLRDLARRAEALKENPVAGMSRKGKVWLFVGIVLFIVFIILVVIASKGLKTTPL